VALVVVDEVIAVFIAGEQVGVVVGLITFGELLAHEVDPVPDCQLDLGSLRPQVFLVDRLVELCENAVLKQEILLVRLPQQHGRHLQIRLHVSINHLGSVRLGVTNTNS